MNQWQHYKELELIPDAAPAPKPSKFNIALPFVATWRWGTSPRLR